MVVLARGRLGHHHQEGVVLRDSIREGRRDRHPGVVVAVVGAAAPVEDGADAPAAAIPWPGCTGPMQQPSERCAVRAVGLASSPFAASSALVERRLQ